MTKEKLKTTKGGKMMKIKKTQNPAFTLAEMLITLSVIGIVAALTIPGVVKNHNQKAWEIGKDVFQKKLEVALKSMNTDGKLSGYTTTEDFVNELKKNIRINKVCTDDVTKCFAKTVNWVDGEEPIEITNNVVTYAEGDAFDWAETVGVQFNNGVTALMAYNKNCYADPYDNQTSVSDKCLGMIIDVSGNGKPNTNEKDITASNVKSVGKTCAGVTVDDKCVVIVGTDYSALDCTDTNNQKYCGSYFGYTEDFWAGAQYKCETLGMTLPDRDTLKGLVGKPGMPTSGNFWSSTEDSSYVYLAWGVIFSSGGSETNRKSLQFRVLCLGN